MSENLNKTEGKTEGKPVEQQQRQAESGKARRSADDRRSSLLNRVNGLFSGAAPHERFMALMMTNANPSQAEEALSMITETAVDNREEIGGRPLIHWRGKSRLQMQREIEAAGSDEDEASARVDEIVEALELRNVPIPEDEIGGRQLLQWRGMTRDEMRRNGATRDDTDEIVERLHDRGIEVPGEVDDNRQAYRRNLELAGDGDQVKEYDKNQSEADKRAGQKPKELTSAQQRAANAGKGVAHDPEGQRRATEGNRQ